jgi:perosamine synthetase
MGEDRVIPISKPMIGEEEKRAVLEVLDSGILAQGPRVGAFEKAFAEMIGVKHAVATSSGTTALHAALLAHRIGKGDEVITCSFSFIASANSILYTGARPVFVDIEPKTFNLDPEKIEWAVTPRTKAILPVHLFGLPAPMDAIMAIAKKHGLAVIEDACQSHGAEYQGKRVGSFGTGAFSLYATKNITSAEGGMITTDDDTIAENCRVIRQHGMRRRYYHDDLGFNFRMTDIHAAIGLAQLAKLEQMNQTRNANAEYLSQGLRGVSTPYVPTGSRHVFHQYTVRVPGEQRDALLVHLKERGIGTGIYYPVPIHQQAFYTQQLGYKQHLPESERAAVEVLSLPVHPALSQSDLEAIVVTVNEFTCDHAFADKH